MINAKSNPKPKTQTGQHLTFGICHLFDIGNLTFGIIDSILYTVVSKIQ